MKYLVISDTHGYIKTAEELIKRYKENIGGVIHLGDLVRDVNNLKAKFSNLEFYFVSGNNDYDVTIPYERKLMLNGRKILIAHGHRQRVNMGLMTINYWAMENNADAVLFGHTHSPVCQVVNGIAIFNPGSISLPRGTDFPTYGFMEVTEEGRIGFELMQYIDENHSEKIASM